MISNLLEQQWRAAANWWCALCAPPGVERVFGLHGAHIDSIFQAALDADLPIIDTRNKATAGHAAEGYARTAHKLGVALVTAGGAMTNVVTPLAQAFMDRTPIARNRDRLRRRVNRLDRAATASRSRRSQYRR
jgi:glyoxylate carboligase